MRSHEPWCGDYRVESEMARVYNGPVPCICERRSGEDRRQERRKWWRWSTLFGRRITDTFPAINPEDLERREDTP